MNFKEKYLSDLAFICGALTGDGHLQINKWRYLTSFYSNDEKQILRMKNMFFRLFNVEGRVYTKEGKNLQYRLFIISKDISLKLKEFGVPVGRKTDKEFGVPEWIMDGELKISSNYLRAIFTAEGAVYSTKTKNGKRWRVEIEMYKREDLLKSGEKYFEDLRKMLQTLEIRSSPVRFGRKNLRKDGTYSVAIKLDIEANQFEKFYKYVGFVDRIKEEKLLQAIVETHRPGRMRRYS
jgi:tRNA-splicing ligase RtcB (3'-phosphate/5'-hydroxy nucleic acid ligase)